MAGRFVARVSKGRTLLLIVGALLFVAAGIWFLFSPETFIRSPRSMGDPGFVSLIGWAGVLFFGICAIVGMRQLFRTDAVIEMGPEGLLWRRWSNATIPWTAFDHAAVAEIHRQRMLTLWLQEPEAYPSTTLSGRMAGANKAMGFGDLSLSASGLDCSFDELVAAFDTYASEPVRPELTPVRF